jgi:UDP-N-acetylglucosamine--N-acetylmuramyl-(pentapeptide) pyrophosphoryl-undecaprenol N-acetylglucosamine transferase
MARAYASAFLVIARAGATSLAEMCAIGRPSILIPFAHAADAHQEKNARALEAAGAAVVLDESGLTPAHLAEQVAALVKSPERRRAMADAARAQGHSDAAAVIVDDACARFGKKAARDPGSCSGAETTEMGCGSESTPESHQAKVERRRPRVKRCELRVRERERELIMTASA